MATQDCKLGCGSYRVLATDRCGSNTVCELRNISKIEWSRKMDETAEYIITIDLSGGADVGCCECIGGLRTWIHGLKIYRSIGGLVAFGPIVNILYRNDEVVITARDVTAWLDVRMIHTTHVYAGQNIMTVARELITDALEPDDPCGLLQNMIIGTSTDTITKTIEANQYAGDALRELAKSVLDYTAIGNRIVVDDVLLYGPYSQLTDENFVAGLEIEERGLEAASKWYVKGSAVVGTAGGAAADTQYMGLVEQLYSDDTIMDLATANTAAANRLKASNPAPLYINVPTDARLSPDAPLCMDQLIPGTLVNVRLRNPCRPVTQQFRLTAMKTTYDADSGDEAVGVTLSPVGTTFNQGGIGGSTPGAGQ